MVKNLPAMQETQVLSLCWEDLLEKGTATHSSILAWRIPWTEKPGGLPSMGSQRVRHNWATNSFTFSLYLIGTLGNLRSNHSSTTKHQRMWNKSQYLWALFSSFIKRAIWTIWTLNSVPYSSKNHRYYRTGYLLWCAQICYKLNLTYQGTSNSVTKIAWDFVRI